MIFFSWKRPYTFQSIASLRQHGSVPWHNSFFSSAFISKSSSGNSQPFFICYLVFHGFKFRFCRKALLSYYVLKISPLFFKHLNTLFLNAKKGMMKSVLWSVIFEEMLYVRYYVFEPKHYFYSSILIVRCCEPSLGLWEVLSIKL